MGKISDALEKAGYREGVEQNSGDSGSNSSRHSDVVEQKSSPTTPKIESQDITSTESRPKQNKKESESISVGSGSGRWDERLFAAVNKDKSLSEIFNTLRSRILHPIDGKAVPRTIMVTSSLPKEGKSFVTSNLGISFAHGLDLHALLVDCDLRKPTLASLFGMYNGKGLVDYLRERKTLPELIGKTSVDKLSILPSGKPPVNPSELLSSARMIDLVKELSSRYDDRIIIFDSPPMLAAAESRVLAKQVDGVILVVRQGKAGRDHIRRVIDTVESDRMIGIVFNDYKINYIEKSYIGGYGGYYRNEE